MTAEVHQRVQESLQQLRLSHVGRRLDSLLSQAAKQDQTFLDFLDQLLTEELEAKQRKRVTMGLQIAHFTGVKTLEAFDFAAQPSVDERLIRELGTGRFVANGENVLLLGPPGVGKSHLAIGLGRRVVEAGYSTLFTSATALLGALSKASAERCLEDKLRYFCKPKLLIIDEMGYLPFEQLSAHMFFQLISRRYERGSVMLTTNRPVTQWGNIFGDEMTAAAILDRLLHHSHAITIQGESYRLKQKRKSGLFSSNNAPTTSA